MPSHIAYSLWFTGPESVEVREFNISEPGPGEVRVRSICSAISAGTEMLAFQNLLPKGIPLDASFAEMADAVEYPFKYGYCVVGVVDKIGPGVDSERIGDKVFAFHPHESHFVAALDELLLIPKGMHVEDALFIANMETAINLLLDGPPMVGEKVHVIGLGVVGQLLTALLSEYPLSQLDCEDPIKRRRLQADIILEKESGRKSRQRIASSQDGEEYDLVFETSGSPEGLDQAIKRTSYNGRLIVGSWYGSKEVKIDLGSHFHRSKMSIYASQVSELDPRLTGRWDKNRRLDVALDMLMRHEPRRMITHQYHINKAASAYVLLKESLEPLQIILTY